MSNFRNTIQFQVKIILLVVVLYFLFCVEGNEVSLKKRVKRKVLFTKSSKFFFRLGGKDTVLNYTTLLAHGWGFRINYDLPHTLNQRHLFFKRDVSNEIETIKDPFISNMVYCILTQVCGVITQPFFNDNCGIFCGIAKIVASSQGIEANFFKSFGEKCQLYRERCPRSFEKSSIFGYG